jgi:hypothetical protein
MLGSPSQSYFAAITSPNARRSSASVTNLAVPLRTLPSICTSTDELAMKVFAPIGMLSSRNQDECVAHYAKPQFGPSWLTRLLRPTVTMSQHSTSVNGASQDTSEISPGGTRQKRRAMRRLLRQELHWPAGLLSLGARRCPCPLRLRAKHQVLP